MVTSADQAAPRHSSRGRVREVVSVLVIVALGAAGFLLWRSRQSYHLATVQEGVLYRDGAKSIAQFDAALKQVNPRTVVSLVDAAEQADPNKPQFKQEADLCATRGIKLERIEVKLGGWPTTENIRRFLAIVEDEKNRPVLVHCAQGVRRTAMFVAAYQESDLGYDPNKAKASILTFGHSENTINDIRRFIDGYDAKERKVGGEGTEAQRHEGTE